MKQYLITVFLVLVSVDAALSRHYRWIRYSRFSRNLRICNKPSILDKLCPDCPDDPECPVDRCANVDCSCNGECNSDDGTCTCFEGFSGVNCENDDVCTIEDYCQNGATCIDNGCNCTANFAGERCEICTIFTSFERTQFVANQFEIIVPPSDDGLISCAARCANFESCTASILRDNDCVFYRDPILDVEDLLPSTLSDECGVICRDTEGCESAYSTNSMCFLLSAGNVEFELSGFFGRNVDVFIRECN